MTGKGDEDEDEDEGLPHFRRPAFKALLDPDESGIVLRQQNTDKKRVLKKDKKLRQTRNLPENNFQSLHMNPPLVPLISADVPSLPDQDDDDLEDEMMENC